jgi:hypothetical protein
VATKMDDISFRIKNCDMYLFICSLFEHLFSNSDDVTSKSRASTKKKGKAIPVTGNGGP